MLTHGRTIGSVQLLFKRIFDCYLSGRKAEIKPFPRLKQQEGDLNSGSAEIVSLWDRKRTN
jgi:hypothetical protein